jgi:hypothetical protein
MNNFEPQMKELVEPASSAHSSDLGENRDDLGTDLLRTRVSYPQLEQMLIDESQLDIQNKLFDQSGSVFILIKGVLPYIDYFLFDKVFKNKQIPVTLLEVRFVYIEGSYSLILGFEKLPHLQIFKKEISKGTFKYIFEPDYELLYIKFRSVKQMECHQNLQNKLIQTKIGVEDDKKDGLPYYSSKFVACVLRGLTKGLIPRLENYLSKYDIWFKLGTLCCFRNHYFCLLYLKCIEDAESVCILLGKIRGMQFPVKVHIHSESSRKRIFKKKSYFYKLFKDNEELSKQEGNLNQTNHSL